MARQGLGDGELAADPLDDRPLQIASQKTKPVAEGVPPAGEGMDHDINRRHGQLQAHDIADQHFIASGAEIPDPRLSSECPRTRAESRT
jgi:hypothetical protein